VPKKESRVVAFRMSIEDFGELETAAQAHDCSPGEYAKDRTIEAVTAELRRKFLCPVCSQEFGSEGAVCPTHGRKVVVVQR